MATDTRLTERTASCVAARISIIAPELEDGLYLEHRRSGWSVCVEEPARPAVHIGSQREATVFMRGRLAQQQGVST